MNDLKNILNYFGEYWGLCRNGNEYTFTWTPCFTTGTWVRKISAKTPEALWKKMLKELNKPVKGYKDFKRKIVKLKDLHNPNTTVYIPIHTRDGKPIKNPAKSKGLKKTKGKI